MRRTLTCNRVMCATVCVSPQLAAASLVYGVPNRPRFLHKKNGPNAQRCEKDPGRVPSHTTLPSVPRRPLGAQNGLLGAGGWVFLVKNRGRFGTPYTRLAAASCGLTHTVAHMTRLHVSVRRMHLVECQCVQAYKHTLAHASLFTQGTPLLDRTHKGVRRTQAGSHHTRHCPNRRVR